MNGEEKQSALFRGKSEGEDEEKMEEEEEEEEEDEEDDELRHIYYYSYSDKNTAEKNEKKKCKIKCKGGIKRKWRKLNAYENVKNCVDYLLGGHTHSKFDATSFSSSSLATFSAKSTEEETEEDDNEEYLGAMSKRHTGGSSLNNSSCDFRLSSVVKFSSSSCCSSCDSSSSYFSTSSSSFSCISSSSSSSSSCLSSSVPSSSSSFSSSRPSSFFSGSFSISCSSYSSSLTLPASSSSWSNLSVSFCPFVSSSSFCFDAAASPSFSDDSSSSFCERAEGDEFSHMPTARVCKRKNGNKGKARPSNAKNGFCKDPSSPSTATYNSSNNNNNNYNNNSFRNDCNSNPKYSNFYSLPSCTTCQIPHIESHCHSSVSPSTYYPPCASHVDGDSTHMININSYSNSSNKSVSSFSDIPCVHSLSPPRRYFYTDTSHELPPPLPVATSSGRRVFPKSSSASPPLSPLSPPNESSSVGYQSPTPMSDRSFVSLSPEDEAQGLSTIPRPPPVSHRLPSPKDKRPVSPSPSPRSSSVFSPPFSGFASPSSVENNNNDNNNYAALSNSAAYPSLAVWKPSDDIPYDASSPDELALICLARHIGVEFVCKPSLNSAQLLLTNELCEDLLLTPHDKTSLGGLRSRCPPLHPTGAAAPTGEGGGEGGERDGGINIEQKEEEKYVASVIYQVLEVLEFDNFRKRMSVIIRDRTNGKIKLLIKGADSSMLEVATSGQQHTIQAIKDALSELASRGLRTLVLGIRDVTEEEFNEFRTNIIKAKNLSENEREKLVKEAYDHMEKDIILLGCTGIEDKLQDMVAETIEDIKSAGVKLWVLTGDKMETAISIGHSCNLLTDTTYNAIVNATSPHAVKEQLHQYMSYIIAGQLAAEAFEQMFQQPVGDVLGSDLVSERSDICMERVDEEKETGKNQATGKKSVGGCVKCVVDALKKSTKMGRNKDGGKNLNVRRRRNEPPTMPWDDFVKIITFNAQQKHVKSHPKQRKARRLSHHQVERLIEEYLAQLGSNKDDSKELNSSVEKQNKLFPANLLNVGGGGGARQNSLSKKNVPRTSTKEKMQEEEINKSNKKGDNDDDENVNSMTQNQDKGGDTNVYNNNFPPCHSYSSLQDSSCSYLRDEGATPRGLEGTHAYVQGYQMCAITITGEALTHALETEENRRYFFGLAGLCETVLACRVSPKQKSEVVRLCRKYKSDVVALGIGDGANDVGMLITANVGVGISGKEGLQAVRAADFAIGEFRFVKNLMFCHGKESLRRNSLQVYQTIWKNLVFGSADFFFGFFSLFSATDIFNSWIKQLYNVFYTTLPVMIYSIFDRQLPYAILLQTPALYTAFQRMGYSMFAGSPMFWRWMIYALYASCILVIFPLYSLTSFSAEIYGRVLFGIPSYGAVVFWAIVLECNLVLVPYINTWFWFLFLSFLFNFVMWLLSWWLCPLLPGDFCPELYGTISLCNENLIYHFVLLLSVFAAILPQLVVWFFWTIFYPSAPVIIRERICKGVFDVVVAPRTGQRLTVVVPKKDSNEWRGFAFAEQEEHRWYHYKRLSSIRLPPRSNTTGGAPGEQGGGNAAGVTWAKPNTNKRKRRKDKSNSRDSSTSSHNAAQGSGKADDQHQLDSIVKFKL